MNILAILLVAAYCIWKYWPYILGIANCLWNNWPLSWLLFSENGNMALYLGKFILFMEILDFILVIAYCNRKFWSFS